MLWNKGIQLLARGVHFRRGFFARFLRPAPETHTRLFGRYQFHMDLSLGRAAESLFLKPDNYEAETQDALRALIKPGMTVLDIGANTGYFSVLMADLVGPSGHVYSFEPFSVNFLLLQENILLNKFQQVQYFQKALSDRSGEAVLHLNPINDGGHSLGDFSENPDWWVGIAPNSKRPSKTQTLDEFIQEKGIAHVDVIKSMWRVSRHWFSAGAKKLLSQKDAPAINLRGGR